MSEFIWKEQNMPKGSPERTAARREEIINACEKLYQVMSFREITLKEIGNETSFSRPTIYNYFETKEEIFLALYEREYDRWNEELQRIITENEQLSHRQIAEQIALSLEQRQQLLKLLSMNNYDMEANSREELLTSFKAAYGRSMQNIGRILIAYFSWSGNTRGVAEEIQRQTGADILEITPAEPYSTDYNTVLMEAQEDQHRQARPELSAHVENIDAYGTIMLGYPNWWASIPMPIASFLEEYDLSDKQILPFCSHGGGSEAWGVLMSATVGVPLYACGGGTIPLLQQGLWDGMSMGSAAAFMITGPATKITNLGALKIAMGWRRFALYILYVILFSFLCGMAVNLIV